MFRNVAFINNQCLGLSDNMARRRARRVKIPDSEKLRIIEKQSRCCAYCGNMLHVKDCLIEEVRSEKSENYSETLVQELKQWRNERRIKDKVPAFLIMHDATLKSIAAIKPHDRDSFIDIHNCGKVTWEKYGEEIIAIVRKFKPSEESIDEEDFQNISLQAICESCDSSKKQAIRIPEGQMEKISDLGGYSVAETVRMALAEYLRNLEPKPQRNALPSNLEKHLVIRERDGVLVKVIYM
tara:strand:+ start:216 stop:932 length:717 start_codon:yes stop_codon:yes gene_type:complete